MIACMLVFLLVYGRTNALSAAECSQVNTITQLSTVSLQCMISNNNTLEVYVHWEFYVSSTMISMGVMMLDCGNIQITIIDQYTIISEGNNNVIGSYNVSLPSIPSDCSVISCVCYKAFYGTRRYKLQIPTCTPPMSQEVSTSLSPFSMYSSVMLYPTSLLTVTDIDTIIPSNAIANTLLPSTVSTNSTITNVKLISTSITATIELTANIKSVNITSNIQSIAVTTTIASNRLTNPNTEINSTKFSFTNFESANKVRTIKLIPTKSVSATSVIKSVNTSTNIVHLTASNIELHSPKFSSTNFRSTSDTSIISTESVRVTSTIIEFTFNHMSSSVVVLSSSIPSLLLASDVNNKSKTLIAIVCTVVVTVVITIAVMSIVWMFSRRFACRKSSLKQHKFDKFDEMWTPVLQELSPSPSVVTVIAPLSPTFCDYLDVTKETKSNQYNDSTYATIQQNETLVCTSASTSSSSSTGDSTSYTLSLSSGIYSDIQLYSPYQGKLLSHSLDDLTKGQVTTDQSSSILEKPLQDSIIIQEESPQSDSALISVNSQSLIFSLKVQGHQTSTKMSPLDMTAGGLVTETSHTLPKHVNSDLSSSTEYDLKEHLPYIHTYYFD